MNLCSYTFSSEIFFIECAMAFVKLHRFSVSPSFHVPSLVFFTKKTMIQNVYEVCFSSYISPEQIKVCS